MEAPSTETDLARTFRMQGGEGERRTQGSFRQGSRKASTAGHGAEEEGRHSRRKDRSRKGRDLGHKRPAWEEQEWLDWGIRGSVGVRTWPRARGTVSGELRAAAGILRVTLKGENQALSREGLESPWKRRSGTRMVRTCLGEAETEKDDAKDEAEGEPKKLPDGVGEGRGAPGGTWPPPGRKFRPAAAVGWGPGWAVERTQKTAEFGNIQDECQPLTKDGLVCQAGNVGLAKERGWRR